MPSLDVAVTQSDLFVNVCGDSYQGTPSQACRAAAETGFGALTRRVAYTHRKARP
jgi:hypothetical protein